ncbi:MAG TPA: O-antigen ligase family protein [Acidimicrobiales bacterium]
MSPTTTPEQTRRRLESRRWDRLARPAMAWLVVAALAAAAGVAVALNAIAGLAAAVLVLAFGIFVADPILVVVVVLPASILIQRVGGSSTNLSVADLMVFVGAIVCLFQVEWAKAHHLKGFLRGIVWYEAVLVLVVVAHPFRADIVEWFHRFSYLAGSTLVGWVVAYHGRARQALRLYLWGAGLLALLALEHAATNGFQPAQWGVYQKNAIGAVLWVAIVTAHLNPPWAHIPKVESRLIEVVCLLGLLASQSRQSAILVVLALGTAILLNSDVRGRAKMIVFIAVPIVGIVYYSFALAFQNNPQFNSVAIRFGQIGAAIHVWHSSPVLGLGMRFYNLPQYLTVTAPPNSLVDNLSSTGIVGSLAFFFLVIVTMRSLGRLPRVYGTIGLVVLLGHYVDGLFDTFWIGALSITPFIIAGISLGMADADPGGQRVPDLLAEAAAAKHHPIRRSPRRSVAHT